MFQGVYLCCLLRWLSLWGRTSFVLIAALFFVAQSPSTFAQVYVQPRLAYKSQVRHYNYQWWYIDLDVGPDRGLTLTQSIRPVRAAPPPGLAAGPEAAARPASGAAPAAASSSQQQQATNGGQDEPGPAGKLQPPAPAEAQSAGEARAQTSPAPAQAAPAPRSARQEPVGKVRLFFYAREHKSAEHAAALIASAYRRLSEQFQFTLSHTFPYVLYNTYQEFLETNIFPLQEGVLGVTNPRNLQVLLPYLGDHRLFHEVGTHELAHQFTIQKVRAAARQQEANGDPLNGMPLWFIEGLAEYYSQDGIDPKAEMVARDLVLNPDAERGYSLLGFFEDRPYSTLWTYKVGQVRVGFMEEFYGSATVQRVLERSPCLVGSKRCKAAVSFQELLSQVTGDSPRLLAARFEEWLKHRSYRSYLSSRQSAPDVTPLPGWEGYVQALNSSPDGNLLLYRTIEPTLGRVSLVLVDRRAPRATTQVAVDGGPGLESLHPVAGRNFSLTNDVLVFVAQSGGADVIYRQIIRHRATRQQRSPAAADLDTHHAATLAEPPAQPAPAQERWKIGLSLGKRLAFPLADQGLIAADAPAISPDGNRIAFVGLDQQGRKDLYVLVPMSKGFQLSQITHDVWAEREVSWGPGGIVFTSDATEHGRYNLFRVDPEHPDHIERLTTEARDHFAPLATPDGRTFFVTYENARADVHEVVGKQVFRRTDVSTGLFDICPGPDGGFWALWYQSGRYRPVSMKRSDLLNVGPTPVQPVATSAAAELAEPPPGLPRTPLTGAKRYSALSWANWNMGYLFGFLGASTGGIFGRVLASANDQLNNHVMVLDVFAYGKFDLINGSLLYLNQESRLSWGGGPFQALEFRFDKTFQDQDLEFTSTERFFGVLGLLRWPLDSFRYLQGDLAFGAVQYTLSDAATTFLSTPAETGAAGSLLDEWEAANSGTRMQIRNSVRFGYDTLLYHPATGPLSGASLLLEAATTAQPLSSVLYESLRADGAYYLPVWGRTHLMLRAGIGTIFQKDFNQQFFLSSFDTLRGVPFGDQDFLLGRDFLFTTAELQFPVNSIVRLLFIPDLEGIFGFDFGGVADEYVDVWNKRVLDMVLGVNFGFGPLAFRLHFAKPLNIGAPLPNDGNWVTNFSVNWPYF